jgi:hypothetical protein
MEVAPAAPIRGRPPAPVRFAAAGRTIVAGKRCAFLSLPFPRNECMIPRRGLRAAMERRFGPGNGERKSHPEAKSRRGNVQGSLSRRSPETEALLRLPASLPARSSVIHALHRGKRDNLPTARQNRSPVQRTSRALGFRCACPALLHRRIVFAKGTKQRPAIWR